MYPDQQSFAYTHTYPLCRESEERRKWHEEKMASKVTRPAAQLAKLGLQPGRVLHVVVEAE